MEATKYIDFCENLMPDTTGESVRTVVRDSLLKNLIEVIEDEFNSNILKVYVEAHEEVHGKNPKKTDKMVESMKLKFEELYKPFEV